MLNFYYMIHFLECGHFCIKYILKKYKLKKKVVYNKRLMSLGLVKRVLSEYFANVKCFKITDINHLKTMGECMSLIKINRGGYHYIVIRKIDNKFVYYFNPAFLFLKKKKIEKFNKCWTNYCCFFS